MNPAPTDATPSVRVGTVGYLRLVYVFMAVCLLAGTGSMLLAMSALG